MESSMAMSYRMVALLVVLGMGHGCSYTHYAEPMRDAAYARDIPRAFQELQENSLITPDGKNRLLYYFEQGTLFAHMGKFAAAEKSYTKASQLIDALYTQSISRKALSFIINDSTTEYRGEEYEIIALHVMKALLYLEQNALEKAGVEARRINTRLRELHQDQKGEKDRRNSYQVDAFALYLSGVIFEMQGEVDGAIVDYRKSLGVYEQGYPGGAVPPSLVLALYRLAKAHNRPSVAALLERGHPHVVQQYQRPRQSLSSGVVVLAKGYPVVPKEAKDFVLSMGGTIIRYSWPSIPSTSVPFPSYWLRVGSEPPQEFEVVQSFDDIARVVLDEKRLALTAKSISRIAAKQVFAHKISEHHQLLGLMAQLLAAITETADTRGWLLLPGKIGMQRISLPHGQHTLLYRQVGTSRTVTAKINITPKDPIKVLVLDYTRPHLQKQVRQKLSHLLLTSWCFGQAWKREK